MKKRFTKKQVIGLIREAAEALLGQGLTREVLRKNGEGGGAPPSRARMQHQGVTGRQALCAV